MSTPLKSCCLAIALLTAMLAVSAKEPAAATKDDPKTTAKDDKSDEIKLPPFPADRTIHQTMQLAGRTIHYDATVGSLPVLDEKGKTIASVMFTAYTVPGSNRAVTGKCPASRKARGKCRAGSAAHSARPACST